MTYQTIKFETEGPLGVLTLNRQERLNAISREVTQELQDLVTRLETDDEVRVLIVTGSGRAFCAGADIKERAENLDDLSLARTSAVISPHVPAVGASQPGEHRRSQRCRGRRRPRAGDGVRSANRELRSADGASGADARHPAGCRRHATTASSHRPRARQGDDALRQVHRCADRARVGTRECRVVAWRADGRRASLGSAAVGTAAALAREHQERCQRGDGRGPGHRHPVRAALLGDAGADRGQAGRAHCVRREAPPRCSSDARVQRLLQLPRTASRPSAS